MPALEPAHRHIDDRRLEEARDQLRVIDDHALLELLRARAPAPEQLDEYLAHVAKRLLEDRRALGVGLFRERTRDVPRRDIAPPAQRAKRDKIEQAREA